MCLELGRGILIDCIHLTKIPTPQFLNFHISAVTSVIKSIFVSECLRLQFEVSFH